MSDLGLPYGETITVHDRVQTGVDASHLPTYEDVDTDVEGCAIWDGSATENIQGGDTSTSDLVILAPGGTLVRDTQEVTARGQRYKVTGRPANNLNPMVGDTNVVIKANLVTG